MSRKVLSSSVVLAICLSLILVLVPPLANSAHADSPQTFTVEQLAPTITQSTARYFGLLSGDVVVQFSRDSYTVPGTMGGPFSFTTGSGTITGDVSGSYSVETNGIGMPGSLRSGYDRFSFNVAKVASYLGGANYVQGICVVDADVRLVEPGGYRSISTGYFMSTELYGEYAGGKAFATSYTGETGKAISTFTLYKADDITHVGASTFTGATPYSPAPPRLIPAQGGDTLINFIGGPNYIIPDHQAATSTQWATITVDGDAGDWAALIPALTDPSGDSGGPPGTDIKHVYTAIDGSYAYIMVETYGPIYPTATLEINFDYKSGQHATSGTYDDLHTNIGVTTLSAWIDNNLDGNLESYPISGYTLARGDVLEAAIPLSQIENAAYFNPTFVNVWTDQNNYEPTFIIGETLFGTGTTTTLSITSGPLAGGNLIGTWNTVNYSDYSNTPRGWIAGKYSLTKGGSVIEGVLVASPTSMTSWSGYMFSIPGGTTGNYAGKIYFGELTQIISPSGIISGTIDLYEVVEAAPVSKTETVADGDTIDASLEASTAVYVSGGSGVPITVAKYASNPASGFAGDIGKYVDVFVPDTRGVSEITIRLYYTEAEIAGLDEQSLKLYWLNGSSWQPCSDTGVAPDADYIWAKLRADTTPDLSYLSGGPFGGGGAGGNGGGGDGGAAPVPVFPDIYIGIAAVLGAGVLAFFIRRRLVQQG